MDRARILALACLVIGVGAEQLAAQGPRSAPHGFAADRLARIDRVLQEYVDSGRIAGAVAMHDGEVGYRRAVGWSDVESHRQMTSTTLFRIASQSKALTSVVILSLMEEGKLSVNDPVSRYIPAFAHTTVASRSDTGRVIKAASRPNAWPRCPTSHNRASGGSTGTTPTSWAAWRSARRECRSTS